MGNLVKQEMQLSNKVMFLNRTWAYLVWGEKYGESTTGQQTCCLRLAGLFSVLFEYECLPGGLD